MIWVQTPKEIQKTEQLEPETDASTSSTDRLISGSVPVRSGLDWSQRDVCLLEEADSSPAVRRVRIQVKSVGAWEREDAELEHHWAVFWISLASTQLLTGSQIPFLNI